MLKLNLGCGPHVMDGWVNYDMDPHPGALVLDLSQGKLPHEDNSVDYIFSEHFIEHIQRDALQRLLGECRRVLKPGGKIRLSTPDLFAWAIDYIEDRVAQFDGVWEPKSPAQMLNEGMRLWGHTFLYDISEIDGALRDAGFACSGRVGWRSSTTLELTGLEVRPSYNDLIVESLKTS